MPVGLVTVSYIGSIILFILALGGLSNPETSRRGNAYGITGMTIAVLATVLGPQVNVYVIIMICMLIGGTIGIILALKVQMTQMPELVAILHSLVGMAAVLVGYVNFMDPLAAAHFSGAEKTIHDIEIYVGVLIGAVTFTGSVIAYPR